MRSVEIPPCDEDAAQKNGFESFIPTTAAATTYVSVLGEVPRCQYRPQITGGNEPSKYDWCAPHISSKKKRILVCSLVPRAKYTHTATHRALRVTRTCAGTERERERLALEYVRVPSGLVTNDASPAARLPAPPLVSDFPPLPVAASSISITDGAKDGGRRGSASASASLAVFSFKGGGRSSRVFAWGSRGSGNRKRHRRGEGGGASKEDLIGRWSVCRERAGRRVVLVPCSRVCATRGARGVSPTGAG